MEMEIQFNFILWITLFEDWKKNHELMWHIKKFIANR